MFGRKRGVPPPDPDELYERAKQAGRSPGPRDEQEGLLRQAAELGHKVAMFDLGVLIEAQHRFPEARQWFERARDAGHILAERKLAALGEREAERAAGSADEELALLREEAEYGEPDAMTGYGVRLWAMGQQQPGIDWVRRAADTGHPDAIDRLARMLQHVPGEQERLLRLNAESGTPRTVRALAEYLKSNHRPEAAEVLHRLVQLGDPWAAYQLGEVHQHHGDVEQALHWYQQALADRVATASAHGALGRLLTELGRVAEAEPHLRSSAGSGDLHLAWILENRGEYAEAEELYRELAELDIDNADAMAGLARMLERRGEHDEARGWREESEGGGADPAGPGWPT